MRWWKYVGLAGIVGVAATGVLIARQQRQRNAYTPDEVRDRLHARLAQVPPIANAHSDSARPQGPTTGHW